MSSADSCAFPTRTSWRRSLLAPQVWRRGACYGLPAGLIQAALNQGDSWLTGHVTGTVMMKTILSPLVGFAVAYVAAVTTHHETQRRPVEPSVCPAPATAPKHGVS